MTTFWPPHKKYSVAFRRQCRERIFFLKKIEEQNADTPTWRQISQRVLPFSSHHLCTHSLWAYCMHRHKQLYNIKSPLIVVSSKKLPHEKQTNITIMHVPIPWESQSTHKGTPWLRASRPLPHGRSCTVSGSPRKKKMKAAPLRVPFLPPFQWSPFPCLQCTEEEGALNSHWRGSRLMGRRIIQMLWGGAHSTNCLPTNVMLRGTFLVCSFS